MGSLKSNKERPLPKTPTDLAPNNNNYYSVPRSHHTPLATPVTSPSTTPWATPRGSPKFDLKSLGSDTVDAGNSGKIFLVFVLFKIIFVWICDFRLC